MKAWNRANPERVRSNPERVKAYGRAADWYEEHREKIRGYLGEV
jgi:hypothetical protein